MNGHVEENGNVRENGHNNNNKGNEDKKIFVGGIAYDVSNEDLTSHFGEFGEVANAQVKFDRQTGRSRGFAFVEFTTGEACKAALGAREQTIKGKSVEVKPAKSRENKKVFVGGLPSDFNESELRSHFEQLARLRTSNGHLTSKRRLIATLPLSSSRKRKRQTRPRLRPSKHSDLANVT
jgi:squid-like protein